MTKEEALDTLKYNSNVIHQTINGKTDPKEVEALGMAIEALEKDIPKAPKKGTPRYGMGYEYYDWYCPTCNKFLAFECDTKRQNIHHCKCGQRLDWGKAL